MHNDQPIRPTKQPNQLLSLINNNLSSIIIIIIIAGGIIYSMNNNGGVKEAKASPICTRADTSGCTLDIIKMNRDELKKQKAEQAAIKSELESQLNKVNTNNTNIDQEDAFWSDKFNSILNK
jgi:FtsZ-binding cell division protein ZapB